MKTTVDVDRELAEEAALILGTTSLKDTVNAALRAVVATALRRRLAERVRSGTLPVPTPEEYHKLREPKVPPGALDGLDTRPSRPRRRHA
ncbi:MAG TPA: type II toxin-antitoxin system VapB family antitoxin [Gaiellaceae bacterium]|nr:type II toxin-antitoxin system VapB family antitoxin [Gaiellaceae bacterium]